MHREFVIEYGRFLVNTKIDWILVLVAITAFLFVTRVGRAEGLHYSNYQAAPSIILQDNNLQLSEFARHFAVSYAITSLTYLFVTKRLGWDPIPSFFFSAMLAGMAGVAFEGSEATAANNGHDRLGQAMLYNAAGSLGAGLTFAIIDF